MQASKSNPDRAEARPPGSPGSSVLFLLLPEEAEDVQDIQVLTGPGRGGRCCGRGTSREAGSGSRALPGRGRRCVVLCGPASVGLRLPLPDGIPLLRGAGRRRGCRCFLSVSPHLSASFATLPLAFHGCSWGQDGLEFSCPSPSCPIHLVLHASPESRCPGEGGLASQRTLLQLLGLFLSGGCQPQAPCLLSARNTQTSGLIVQRWAELSTL